MVFDHSLRVYMTAKRFTKEHTYVTDIHTYITYIYTYTHICTMYIHTYIHTCMHAYMHTYTHIHVHDSCWHTWLCLTLNRLAAKGLRNMPGLLNAAPF